MQWTACPGLLGKEKGGPFLVVGSRYFSGGEQFGKVPVGRWEPSATCWHLVNSRRGRA